MKNLATWDNPAVIARNGFKYKSLSDWSLNTAVGCAHACRFCYVPEVSTNRMGKQLAALGVSDPDAEWGSYVFPRRWDRDAFMTSLGRADRTPREELSLDGNRAVMLSTTTDPYQVLPAKAGLDHAHLVRSALKAILEHSSLRVRILTRSPLARNDFALMKSFGNRLLFGMSLPTLDDRLARIYEPHAPAPSRRLECLKAARAAGLNVFVAMAPTYPECGNSDMARTLDAIGGLNPVTVFMEPINIRAENVARIEAHAASRGLTVDTSPFKSREAWVDYAHQSLRAASYLGASSGLPMHLWPDASLGTKANLAIAAQQVDSTPGEVSDWLQRWWNRVSEWPK